MANGVKRVGVLLLNLGTPDAPDTRAVRRYLREFLSDPRVLDMNPVGRFLLLYGGILPFRPRRSAALYRSVWTARGAPLLVHSRDFAGALAKELGPDYSVELAMRYGAPPIAAGLERLASASVERIVVVPLFPQYASSSTGSALERVYALARARANMPPLAAVEPFFAEPDFIAALAAVSGPELAEFRADHVVMSYHGLPERQVRKSDSSGGHCLASEDCCAALGAANANCYRAQCFATSRALAAALSLDTNRYSVAFQSRLGRTPWIRPFTDEELPRLAEQGVRRLAILCPSFVADCLETLEEVGIRARDQWRALGGEALHVVPCLNAHPSWVQTVCGWVRARGAA